MSNNNSSVSLMARRLGVYNADPKIDHPTSTIEDEVSTALTGVSQQSAVLNRMGGHAQQERMIRDKQRTLDRALRYSYQGATVRDVNAEEDAEPHRALINPNKVKLDYDEKVISINWDANYHPGTVFEWVGTNTFWLVMYQDLTELAYFKGDCRKCHYTVKWANKETAEIYTVYASIIGPKEGIITKTNISAATDEKSYTLDVLIPQTPQTVEYFKRYSKFYFQDYLNSETPITCWQVIQADWISTPGIIHLTAREDYINHETDEVGVVPDYKLILDDIEKQNTTNSQTLDMRVKPIEGESLISPKIDYTFTCSNADSWKIEGKGLPITVVGKTDNSITLRWEKFYSGEFYLHKGESSKQIIVQTLY